MKKFLFAASVVALLGSVSAAHAGALYYGGDLDLSNSSSSGLANESDAIVSDAATYDNFTVSGTWHVTDLFTNNLTNLNITNAAWEIRTGVSEGNGGTLVAGGAATPTVTATGRSGFGFTEFTVDVPVSLTLTSGTYWLSVVPISGDANRSFNSSTFGLNAVGVHSNNLDYFSSSFFGANFTNANNEGIFPIFSSGVLGSAGGVPEPATWALMIIGVGGLGASLRSRRNAALAHA